MLNICIVIYLDNILIYLDNLDTHREYIREVLKRLWDNGLYASSSKCVFHQQKVEFLGFLLSPKEVQMDHKKIQVIQEWPTPRWVKDI